MTNTITPIPSSPISSVPSYQQQPAAGVAQQIQNQNGTLQPPVNTVNPTDKSQNANIQPEQNASNQQEAKMAAIKEWLQNADPLGNTKSTVYKDKEQYMVISTRPDTGELYTYALGPGALNPFNSSAGIEA